MTDTVSQTPLVDRRRATLALGALALGFVMIFPDLAGQAARFALWNMLVISPALLLGIALTAGIVASGSTAIIAAAFAGRDVRMILLASLAGALTPVCGITVLPLVAALMAGGVPLAAIMAFWLSSPVTDPGMLAVTAATLGVEFAIGKTVAAFGIGLAGGLVVLALTRAGYLLNPAKDRAAALAGSDCACDDGGDGFAPRFWREPARRALFWNRALATGRLMAVWLFAAFVAEFFLKRYVPDAWVASLVGGDSLLAVPIATVVGAPIYLDGYAALPLVRGLIDAGMGSGAALAFLVAGGIVSAWAVIPVCALVRLPVFALYILLAVLGSALAGWSFGLFL